MPASDSDSKVGNLIWIDLEMTGLDSANDYIIEIATIVTDPYLHEVASGPELVIGQTRHVMDSMDEWNTKQHGESGLVAKVLESAISNAEAERQTLDFLANHSIAGASPMCGNSICQDRRFLARLMPDLEGYFHYRNLDVSTLKILAQSWAAGVAEEFNKASSHRALDDIRDSIAELRHYRDHLFDQAKILQCR